MTWQQEFWSWMSPSHVETAEPPVVGQKAPATPKLAVPQNGKPTIIAFLRHCGCPCKQRHSLVAVHSANYPQSQRRRSSTCATQQQQTRMCSSSLSHTAIKARPTAGSPPYPTHRRTRSPICRLSWTLNGRHMPHMASESRASSTSFRPLV